MGIILMAVSRCRFAILRQSTLLKYMLCHNAFYWRCAGMIIIIDAAACGPCATFCALDADSLLDGFHFAASAFIAA